MMNDISYSVEFPQTVKVEVDRNLVKITGPKGVVEKKMPSQRVSISTSGNSIMLSSSKPTQREKKLANTYRAHIRHMIVGVLEGHTYKLKVCSGHFPMKVSLSNGVLEVKNFLGENKARLLQLKQGADVSVNGDDIVVSSPNKELAGQVAADIEQLTRITNKDRRIFQDGIYITEKSKTRPIVLEEVAE